MPEAEVNLGILNVCFGGVVYQGVTDSEAAYINRGLRKTEDHAMEYSLCMIFIIFFSPTR